MKNFLKVVGVLIVFAIILVNVNMNVGKSTDMSFFNLSTQIQEAMASSEQGCISKTGENNGDCTTDGSYYFCENSFWFHDCVKGQYP
jgi:hypothetical protein